MSDGVIPLSPGQFTLNTNAGFQPLSPGQFTPNNSQFNLNNEFQAVQSALQPGSAPSGGAAFDPVGINSTTFTGSPVTNPDTLSAGQPLTPYSGWNNYLPGNNAGNSHGTTTIPTASNSSTTTNPTGTTAPATSSITPGSLADYFARTIIVVLGLIFVGVGLNMLRSGTVPMPVKT